MAVLWLLWVERNNIIFPNMSVSHKHIWPYVERYLGGYVHLICGYDGRNVLILVIWNQGIKHFYQSLWVD